MSKVNISPKTPNGIGIGLNYVCVSVHHNM